MILLSLVEFLSPHGPPNPDLRKIKDRHETQSSTEDESGSGDGSLATGLPDFIPPFSKTRPTKRRHDPIEGEVK